MFEDNESKRMIAVSNTNMAHTCGNITSIIVSYFKSKFPKNFFKNTSISTEIAVRQFKKIKDFTDFKWNKPYLIVQPRLLMSDPTEAHIDIWRRLYGTQMYNVSRMSSETCKFFCDEKKGIMVDFAVERTKMSFQFTVNLSTEYQQYNVMSHMINTLRVEHPFYHHVLIETVIPEYVINRISHYCGINEYEDPVAFLKYMNSISNIPVTYEFNSATGNKRYRIVAQTSLLMRFNPPDMDDGDGPGMIKDTFPITITADMEFNYPSKFFFILDGEKATFHQDDDFENRLKIEENKDFEDLSGSMDASFFYTIQKIIIPNEDVHNKKLYDIVAFLTENEDIDEVNFEDIMEKEYLNILKEMKSRSIPYDAFINVVIYEDEKPKDLKQYEVDYENMKVIIRNNDKDATYRIALYLNNNILMDYKLRGYKYQ